MLSRVLNIGWREYFMQNISCVTLNNSELKYKRVLLKLSGEALTGEVNKTNETQDTNNNNHSCDVTKPSMFDHETTVMILEQIKQLVELKVTLGLVIGGGNIFRGLNKSVEFGLQRVNADYMGMLATIMNGIALKDFLTKIGINSQIYSALPVGSIIQGYNRDKMLDDLNNGTVAIFVGGTGNPLFTTDSAAAIRGIEMNADLLIKATKVDGVYDSDPSKNINAKKYATLSFNDAIERNLKVMDMAAFDLCREHKLNIQVCNIFTANVLQNVVLGQNIGTLIYT
jgi:uridylate kinase